MQKDSPLSHNLIVIGLVYLLGFSPIVSAKMYKWVDADGNTHYTQTRPEGIEADIIKPPSSVDVEGAQKLLKLQQKKADSYREKRKKSTQEQAKKEAEVALDNKNCEVSKSNVVRLERPKVSLKDEQGNAYSAPEEERLEKLQTARQDVAKYCR